MGHPNSDYFEGGINVGSDIDNAFQVNFVPVEGSSNYTMMILNQRIKSGLNFFSFFDKNPEVTGLYINSEHVTKEEIDSLTARLPNIRALVILGGKLTALPNFNKKLEKFYIGSNPLEEIEHFPEGGALKHCTIYNCGVSSLPNELDLVRYPNLESLNLELNFLSDLSIINGGNVKVLNIKRNQFVILPKPLSNMEKLEKLFVTDNSKSIPYFYNNEKNQMVRKAMKNAHGMTTEGY